MQISSYFLKGCFFAFKKFVDLDFTQTFLYVNNFSILKINFAVNNPCRGKNIAPLSFTILHIASKASQVESPSPTCFVLFHKVNRIAPYQLNYQANLVLIALNYFVFVINHVVFCCKNTQVFNFRCFEILHLNDFL
jgi:hypothetical protein